MKILKKIMKTNNQIIIHLICPDQKGIISKLTSILYKSNANILSIEQHVNANKFYIRVLADIKSLNIKFEDLKTEIKFLNDNLKGKFNLFDPEKKINVAILGTSESEPIYQLLIKKESKELNCNIPLIISNHNKLNFIAKQFNVKYKKINNNENLLNILEEHDIDLIILARYMQIIPSKIINKYKNKIINIHHSFLPAFKGANPYKQAANKGVKIIGATAHYATEELDEGPIIHQDVLRISHTDTEKQMKEWGRDIERVVLYKAVKAHLEYKIITYNNKTIVFK
tara:strand:- start:433 stop:1284 length:852 start_codon:yes stop_codon:yes gene_type:complete